MKSRVREAAITIALTEDEALSIHKALDGRLVHKLDKLHQPTDQVKESAEWKLLTTLARVFEFDDGWAGASMNQRTKDSKESGDDE